MSTVLADELLRVLRRGKEDDTLGVKIAKAIELIEGVLDDLTEQSVAISFNGGKDCTVLLHLFAAVLFARHNRLSPSLQPLHPHVDLPSTSQTPKENHDAPLSDTPFSAAIDGPTQPPPPVPSSSRMPATSATHHTPPSTLPYPSIRSIYITAPNPFEALDTFVLDSATRYGLELYRFGGGMKAALDEYLSCGGGKGVKGMLVGTRHGDPNGNVEPLAPTDPSWPPFLRIHPILDWSYTEIWAFLKQLDVPYCTLYDQGYTSLGSTQNTVPNPLLRRDDGKWDPAWQLEDESQERAGRLDRSA